MKSCIGEHDYLSPLLCFSYSPSVALVLISFGQQACTFCHLASSLLGSPAVQASTDSAIINLAFSTTFAANCLYVETCISAH